MPINEKLARCVALEQAYVYDVYEHIGAKINCPPWPSVRDFLDNLDPGSLVCDVGCGTGNYLSLNSSIYTMGGDRSRNLCGIAKDQDKEVIVLDNLSLPYRNESLDAVLSVAVIHHFTTIERRVCALRELARVLRIGGRLIISVWAMERRDQKSQDILIPWHDIKLDDSPSSEYAKRLGSSPNHFRLNSSEERLHTQHHLGFSESSSDNSSLSSLNGSCYSFVRKALQKLAHGRKSYRPWFLDGWTSCARNSSPKHFSSGSCENCGYENAKHIPIELRHIDDYEILGSESDVSLQRRNDASPFTSISKLSNTSKVDSIDQLSKTETVSSEVKSTIVSLDNTNQRKQITSSRGKLVKQKQSICDDDSFDLAESNSDINAEVTQPRTSRLPSIVKQTSLNDELMCGSRLQEKENLKRQLPKQASFNEELIYQNMPENGAAEMKESLLFSSTTNRLRLFRNGFANRIRRSTTNLERVTSTSIKNGFVKIIRNWKTLELPKHNPKTEVVRATDEILSLHHRNCSDNCCRRLSKEDGSDSSKDSSLQSDTSVDSEDSFASVIYIPKSNPMSPIISPSSMSSSMTTNAAGNLSRPSTKQSSCPTSPQIKQVPVMIYPTVANQAHKVVVKQSSQPAMLKNASLDVDSLSNKINLSAIPKLISSSTLTNKYSVPPIPKFRKSELKCSESSLKTRAKAHIAACVNNYPIVRHASLSADHKLVKPMPKLLSLEIFNPETDDIDSDSSIVSSPESVESTCASTQGVFNFSQTDTTKFDRTLARADKQRSHSIAVASTRNVRNDDEIQLIKDKIVNSNRVDKVLFEDATRNFRWNRDSSRNLEEFANKLNEKLQFEINLVNSRRYDLMYSSSISEVNDDPCMNRLNEELHDLSKLSAEIRKQNEYFAKLGDDRRTGAAGREVCQCKRRQMKNANANDPGGLHRRLTTTLNDNCCINCQYLAGTKETDTVAAINANLDSLNKILEETVGMGSSQDSIPSSSSGHSTMSRNRTSTSCSIDCGSEATSSLTDVTSSKFTTDSTFSLESACSSSSEWKTTPATSSPSTAKTRPGDVESSSSTKGKKSDNGVSSGDARRSASSLMKDCLPDASQDSLCSENIGGEIIYHRFCHVFRQGELDQLIEEYVKNLHIISSYYDHASWCIVAEKVQMWTI